MPAFVPGLELARAFYEDVVSEILGDTPHAAARIGWGSEVLGFDTERSTDHGWGPRLQVFVAREDVQAVRQAVDSSLPTEFRGWPTTFGWDDVPASHHVEVDTLGDWTQRQIGFDPRNGMTTRDWLATPQQLLLEVTAGAVFHDSTGELTKARATLAWYPGDVWLWIMACQWRRLDQEEPFVGRTAEVGDDLGSRILTSRLARDAIRLFLLQERRYAPYSKWLGSAFEALAEGTELAEALVDAIDAGEHESREAKLVAVVTELAKRHNMLGLTEPVDETVRLFHARPYRVLASSRFVDACLAQVDDEWLRALPLIGGIDQWVDSADVLSDSRILPAARAAYDVLT